jgi:hypothetical protein
LAAKDWAESAQVASSAIAACGLLLAACGLGITAWQMRRTRRTADLQALQKFSEDANKREGALADAADDRRLHAFHEFMNFLELYACAYNNGLVIGRGSRDIIRHKLEDSYIELEAAKEWHPYVAGALDRSTTFAELAKFIQRHRKEVDQRRAERERLPGGAF